MQDLALERLAPNVEEMEKTGRFPWPEIRVLAEHDLLGMGIHEEYGGAGADSLSVILAIEALASISSSISVIFEVHHCLVAESILAWGTQRQKESYLPSLCSGDALGAFALTEPGTGSDARSITTQAVKEGGHYRINGSKSFITSGGEAHLYLIFAATSQGMAAFLIHRDNRGLSFGPPEEKMALHACHTTEIILTDCLVKEEDRLGTEGAGLKVALSALDRGRIGIAAQAIGITQSAYEAALDYAKKREQFGEKIANFQAIQWYLANMATDLKAARLLTYSAAMRKEERKEMTLAASMAKVFASEMAMRHTIKAVQIHGGFGYTREYGVERLMREAKVTEIYEGTSEIQRRIIARNILKNPPEVDSL